jgi:hypothetical protein
MQQIQGYKIKKEFKSYQKYAEKIAQLDSIDSLWDNNLKEVGVMFKQISSTERQLKKAGVIDLWFEPVYEAEFKVGDWVTFYSDIYRKYYTSKIEIWGSSSFCVLENSFEPFKSLVRLATPEEILKALTEEFTKKTGITIGSKIKQKDNYGKYSKSTVGEFFLHDRTISTGHQSGFTENWFRDNPKKRYQLGVKDVYGSMFSPYCELDDVPDIVINDYKAEFFDDYVKFGCAEFDKEVFIELDNYGKLINNLPCKKTNREFVSVKLGKGEFTKEQIKEIVEYYKNK